MKTVDKTKIMRFPIINFSTPGKIANLAIFSIVEQ